MEGCAGERRWRRCWLKGGWDGSSNGGFLGVKDRHCDGISCLEFLWVSWKSWSVLLPTLFSGNHRLTVLTMAGSGRWVFFFWFESEPLVFLSVFLGIDSRGFDRGAEIGTLESGFISAIDQWILCQIWIDWNQLD